MSTIGTRWRPGRPSPVAPAVPAPLTGADGFEAPAQPTRPVLPPLSLVVTEGLLLLRHPAVLGAVPCVALLAVLRVWERVPVRHHLDDTTAVLVLPLTVGTACAAALTALRDRRDRSEDLMATLPVGAPLRLTAWLAATAFPATLAVLLVLADQVHLAAVGGVGRPDPYLLAAGPAAVLLGGASGIALARLSRSWVGAALPAAAVAGILLVTGVRGPSELRRGGWASDWWIAASGRLPAWVEEYRVVTLWRGAVEDVGLPPDPRPLAATTALAAAVAVAVLVPAGLARSGGALALVAVLLVLAAAGVPDEDPALRVAAAAASPDLRFCDTARGLPVCTYPAYRDWVRYWRPPVDGVLAALPPGGPAPRVHQLHTPALGGLGLTDRDRDLLTERSLGAARSADVLPSLSWGRGRARGQAEAALAAATAAWAVGLPTRVSEETSAPLGCSAAGQAREVVALWLAGQATPGAGAALRRAAVPLDPAHLLERAGSTGTQRLETRSPLTVWSFDFLALSPGVDWDPGAAAVAARLLDQPRDDVRALLHAHWTTLLDPATTTADVARLADLPAPRVAAPTLPTCR